MIATLAFHSNKHGDFVDQLCVNVAYRGRGFAKHLLSMFPGRVDLIVDAKNEAAVSLYKKCGFRRETCGPFLPCENEYSLSRKRQSTDTTMQRQEYARPLHMLSEKERHEMILLTALCMAVSHSDAKELLRFHDTQMLYITVAEGTPFASAIENGLSES